MKLVTRARRPKFAALLLASVVALAAITSPLPLMAVELATWIEGNVGLCVEARHVSETAARFAAGPLGTRLEQYPPLVEWWRQNQPALEGLEHALQEQLHASPGTLFASTLGNHTLLAVWPPSDLHGQPTAVLLVEATDEALLARTLEQLVKAREQNPQVHVERRDEVAGLKAATVVFRQGDASQVLYLTTQGPVAIFATSEAALAGVLQRARDRQPAESSLESLATFRAARSWIGNDAAIAAFVNVRAWDQAITAASAARRDDKFLTIWKGLDFAVAAVEIDGQIAARVRVQGRPADLPAGLKTLLQCFMGSPASSPAIPGDVWAVVVAHANLDDLLHKIVLPSALAQERGSRGPGKTVGWSLLETIAERLGRGATFTISPAASEHDALPVNVVLGFDTRAERSTQAARDLELLVKSLIDTVAVAQHSEKNAPVRYREEVQSDARYLLLENIGGLPPGVVPALAFTANRVWIGSNPDAVRHATRDAGTSSAESPLFASLAKRIAGQHSNFAFVNLENVRSWMAAHPDGAARFSPPGADPVASARSWHELEHLLKLADGVLVGVDVDSSGATATVVVGAQPQ